MANIVFKLAFWNMELLVFLKYQKQLFMIEVYIIDI